LDLISVGYTLTRNYWQYSTISVLYQLEFTVAVFHYELPVTISCQELASYSLYNLSANHTENSASIVEMCLPSHCIATVAELTTANPLFRAIPSNEQQTLVLLLSHACFEVSAFQQLPHGANTPHYKR
jgi:uncharacterized membrane protein YccF (DUF307 family)